MRNLILISLAAGCGPAHLGGTIDGQPIGGARDAFFDTVDIELGPLSYEALVIVITDFSEGCAVFEELAEVKGNCDERCEDIVEIAETYHLRSEQFWSTTFYANTSDGIDGEFDLDPAVGDGEFTASFSSWEGGPLQDVDACEESCEDNELLDAEVEDGEDGELTLEDHDDIVRGRFDVSFGGDDGASGSFAARPCDMGEWIGL